MTTCWTHIPDVSNIDRYMAAINKFPMLTPEEEANTLDEGDLGQMKLVLSHLRLGASIARSYAGSGAGNFLPDLISEATVGLLKAAKVFDPQKGRFSTCATAWIRSELSNFALNNSRIVRVATTKGQRKLFFNLKKMRTAITADRGTSTLSEQDMVTIASTLDVRVDEVREMDVRLSGGDMVLDPISSDEDSESFGHGSYLHDEAADPVNILAHAQRSWLEHVGAEEALALLNEREAFIIKNRYVVDEEDQLTLHDLAKIFAVSAERIRQLEVKALKTMRKHLAEYA